VDDESSSETDTTSEEGDAPEEIIAQVVQNVDEPEEVESKEPTYMYYVNDGVYGSFNCILFDNATVNPVLYDVWTNSFYYLSSFPVGILCDTFSP